MDGSETDTATEPKPSTANALIRLLYLARGLRGLRVRIGGGDPGTGGTDVLVRLADHTAVHPTDAGYCHASNLHPPLFLRHASRERVTKLSTTRLRPALSKSMVSLLPSTSAISP